ncbi:MAG: efflux transporter outer membrane subunit [Bacteroidales bacterium]|nr:efflux transporter outer membrane subunit [Bacteroidales bacterium]
MRLYQIQVFTAAACLWASALIAQAQQQISTAQMPQKWQYASEFSPADPVSDDWWRQFQDPTLDSLINLGIDNNYDLLMASRRIEIARQALRQTRASYYPSFNLSGGWTRARSSGMLGDVAGKATTASYFDLGVDMSWELDVFGKITSRAKESKAALNATRAEYDGAMVAMAAKIASAYFGLRTVQAEIQVLERHIAQQDTVVKIAKTRHEVGLASGLDVAQALTTYYSTVASLSSLKSSEISYANSIAVLIGCFPEDVEPLLELPMRMPTYQQMVAVGVPIELLRRRPDVIEAEYTLAQYAAAVGIAKKDFLPTLSLSGSIGTSAHKLDDLFGKQSLTYAIAPTLSWTIFDGFSRAASLASAKEQMQIGIDNYNLTLLTAVEEVENALAAYSADLHYIENLEKVVEEARKSFELSLDLYKQGLTAFINVTDSEISLLQYSNELVSAKGQALSDLVSLYEALGGGWIQ